MTFKLSQDHIELFFCSLRSRFGSNNNPSAKEFQHAYKRLLLNQEIRGNHGNCIIDDETCFLSASNPSVSPSFSGLNCIHDAEKKYGLSFSDVNHDHEYSIICHWPTLTEFQSNVIEYIAGFCVRAAVKQIKCPQCIKAVTEENSEKSYELVNIKDRCGRLIHANSNVMKVVEITEQVIKKLFIMTSGSVPQQKNLSFVLTAIVLENVVSRHG